MQKQQQQRLDLQRRLSRNAAIGDYLARQSGPRYGSGLGTAAVGAGIGGFVGGPVGVAIGGAVGWLIGKLR